MPQPGWLAFQVATVILFMPCLTKITAGVAFVGAIVGNTEGVIVGPKDGELVSPIFVGFGVGPRDGADVTGAFVGKRVEGVGKLVEGVGKRVEGVGKLVEDVGKRVEGVGKLVEDVGKEVTGLLVGARPKVGEAEGDNVGNTS